MKSRAGRSILVACGAVITAVILYGALSGGFAILSPTMYLALGLGLLVVAFGLGYVWYSRHEKQRGQRLARWAILIILFLGACTAIAYYLRPESDMGFYLGLANAVAVQITIILLLIQAGRLRRSSIRQ
jgi:peptidoglycan/LPS O-acetylase OafA/YrhL